MILLRTLAGAAIVIGITIVRTLVMTKCSLRQLFRAQLPSLPQVSKTIFNISMRKTSPKALAFGLVLLFTPFTVTNAFCN